MVPNNNMYNIQLTGAKIQTSARRRRRSSVILKFSTIHREIQHMKIALAARVTATKAMITSASTGCDVTEAGITSASTGCDVIEAASR